MKPNPNIQDYSSNQTKGTRSKCHCCGRPLARSKSARPTFKREPSLKELERMQRAAIAEMIRNGDYVERSDQDDSLDDYLRSLMTRNVKCINSTATNMKVTQQCTKEATGNQQPQGHQQAPQPDRRQEPALALQQHPI